MKTILIIDDQLMYLKSLESAFKKNYNVLTATNFEDSLDILSQDIDISLIDIRLDEEDERNIDGLKIP